MCTSLIRYYVGASFPRNSWSVLGLFSFFLKTIFRNEITTILTPSNSGGRELGRWGWSRFSFWRFLITNPGRWGVVTFFVLEVPDYESAMLIYFYIYIKCTRSYGTGRSFDPIFMKFTWLVLVHSWVNPIVFGNNGPNRTTYMGENVPPKPIFRV